MVIASDTESDLNDVDTIDDVEDDAASSVSDVLPSIPPIISRLKQSKPSHIDTAAYDSPDPCQHLSTDLDDLKDDSAQLERRNLLPLVSADSIPGCSAASASNEADDLSAQGRGSVTEDSLAVSIDDTNTQEPVLPQRTRTLRSRPERRHREASQPMAMRKYLRTSGARRSLRNIKVQAIRSGLFPTPCFSGFRPTVEPPFRSNSLRQRRATRTKALARRRK
ncbi:hypothetical protein SCUP234_13283 [Seiridium cupressi]